jgi:DNA-binding PadR family transcriptional regulator
MKKPHHVPRGLLRLIILRLLKSDEMTGSEISQTLEDWTEGEWKPSPGSIYPLLSSLEADGIIEPTRQEGRSKVYTLSEEGHKQIKFILHHRSDLTHRAHLGRKIWMRILDPGDRANFHISGMKSGSTFLEETIDSLSAAERKRVATRLGKLIDNLIALKKSLEKGEITNDE